MQPTLFLAPTPHVALNHALARGREAQQARPLAPVHLLLPDAYAIQQARRQLRSTLGVHLFQFYRLAHHVLDRAGTPVHELGEVSLHRLLRQTLDELAEEGYLTTFAPMGDKPGFVQVLREWLREMKTQGVDPAQVVAHRRTERDDQLAALYDRYQFFLQHHRCSDADGLLWLAAEALETDPALLADATAPFLVVGFDQLSPVQRRILRQLAARRPAFALYLLWDEARPADSLALTRLRETRAALERELPGLRVESLPDDCTETPILRHLRHTLFEAPAPRADKGPHVRAIAAPSREGEVRAALRTVKQRLLAGVVPSSIALLAPEPTTYARLVHAVATEYAVPVRDEPRLLANPAVVALLTLLDLSSNDFPWRETFDALRSPYVRQPWLEPVQVAALERLSRERPVVGGWSDWQHALRPLSSTPTSGADDRGDPPLAATLPPAELAAIARGLRAFFDHLTPPDAATPHDYTLWVQAALLGIFPDDPPDGAELPASLHLLACAQADPATRERDEAALRAVIQALRALVEATSLLPPTDETVPWPIYRTELVNVLSSMTLPPSAGPAVRFGPLEAGRAVTVEHLFVLGLSEGEFPRPPAPDPLYAPAERAASRLPLRQIDPAEDASLWWQVVGNARRTLTLLRPRLDDRGTPWLPSPYWGAVLAQVEGLAERVEEPPIEATPAPTEAASRAELLVALARARATTVPATLRERWQHARRAHDVLVQRADRAAPLGPHEGTLLAPDLRASLADRFGEAHRWSVSRLNDYGRCPYGFFARHVLALEPLPDPDEGFTPAQRGNLIHAILEDFYATLAHAGLTPAPATRDEVLARLDESCEPMLAAAPHRYGFRPTALWGYEREELRRMLHALVAWECEQDDGFRPFRQELRFGFSAEAGDRLVLEADGVRFAVRGLIDRIDRDDAGRLRVIDYKSGSASYSATDIEKGLALQTALYALAAERLLPDDLRVAESFYLPIPQRRPNAPLQFEGAVAGDTTVQAALTRAASFVAAVRAGLFPSAPGKPQAGGRSCGTCDFAALCRVSRATIAKARRGRGDGVTRGKRQTRRQGDNGGQGENGRQGDKEKTTDEVRG